MSTGQNLAESWGETIELQIPRVARDDKNFVKGDAAGPAASGNTLNSELED